MGVVRVVHPGVPEPAERAGAYAHPRAAATSGVAARIVRPGLPASGMRAASVTGSGAAASGGPVAARVGVTARLPLESTEHFDGRTCGPAEARAGGRPARTPSPSGCAERPRERAAGERETPTLGRKERRPWVRCRGGSGGGVPGRFPRPARTRSGPGPGCHLPRRPGRVTPIGVTVVRRRVPMSPAGRGRPAPTSSRSGIPPPARGTAAVPGRGDLPRKVGRAGRFRWRPATPAGSRAPARGPSSRRLP